MQLLFWAVCLLRSSLLQCLNSWVHFHESLTALFSFFRYSLTGYFHIHVSRLHIGRNLFMLVIALTLMFFFFNCKITRSPGKSFQDLFYYGKLQCLCRIIRSNAVLFIFFFLILNCICWSLSLPKSEYKKGQNCSVVSQRCSISMARMCRSKIS